MAADLFYGWTATQLLDELVKAQQDLVRGKTLVGSGGGEVSASMAVQATARARIRMIQQALYQLDPTTYAAFKFAGHRQTTAYFAS